MAQIDSNATKEQIAQMEREFARKRAAAARRRAAELARLSEERTLTGELDGVSVTWTYVVVDGAFVRIIACDTLAEVLVVPETIGGRAESMLLAAFDAPAMSGALEAPGTPTGSEGLPVREIDPEAFSGLLNVREIILPDAVESIGAYAFRGCENLERLVLPASTNSFAASWTAKCPNLKELVLPDSLETITSDVLANPAVEALAIGAGTRFVQAGAFEKTHLRAITIDARNEHLATDGTCIYAADGAELVALARSVPSYEVTPGCKRIARKAFAGAKALERIALPEGVASIGELAFANSGITSLVCPSSLLDIGPKACLRCLSLERVELNDGLRAIGDEAFAGSALPALRIPASVERIGASVTVRTRVRHAEGGGRGVGDRAGDEGRGEGACHTDNGGKAGSEPSTGDGATFVIDPANAAYFIDPDGCLYRNDQDGLHLAQMLEPDTASYQVNPRTVVIDPKSFAYLASLESVDLPEGLERIGDGAFRVCRKLRNVSVPSTLESVGADAFIDTALERFYIPEGLVDIGRNALVTDGAHHEGKPPALREIDVDPRNPRFFMHTGALYRRVGGGADGGVNAVMFTCSCERVELHEDTLVVEDYAFNNAFGICELHINARLNSIGACGLSVMSQIRHVRIDVAKPIEGKSSFVLNFPATTHSVHGFLLALGGLGSLYLPDIMAQYDNCIASARDYYDPTKAENASAYDQVKLIIERLSESILLTDANKKRYRSLVLSNIEEICVDIARHDDRGAIRQLADLELLTADNVDAAIMAVNRLQDAAMTAYLLELKRLRFGYRVTDFDL